MPYFLIFSISIIFSEKNRAKSVMERVLGIAAFSRTSRPWGSIMMRGKKRILEIMADSFDVAAIDKI